MEPHVIGLLTVGVMLVVNLTIVWRREKTMTTTKPNSHDNDNDSDNKATNKQKRY